MSGAIMRGESAGAGDGAAAGGAMDAASTARRRRTALGATLAGWRVFVPVVVLNAAVQALLVLGDPVPGAEAVFVLLALLSAAVVLVAAWAVASAALSAVDRRPVGVLHRPARDPEASVGPTTSASHRPARRVRAFGWVVGCGLVIAVGGVLNPLLAPLLLVATAFVLPAAVDTAGAPRNPLRAGLGVFRSHPVRAILTVVGLLIIAVLAWLATLLLGFFVTGPLASGLAWLVFGFTAVVALCLTSALHRR